MMPSVLVINYLPALCPSGIAMVNVLSISELR
jgi:hypothetical protein